MHKAIGSIQALKSQSDLFWMRYLWPLGSGTWLTGISYIKRFRLSLAEAGNLLSLVKISVLQPRMETQEQTLSSKLNYFPFFVLKTFIKPDPPPTHTPVGTWFYQTADKKPLRRKGKKCILGRPIILHLSGSRRCISILA